MITEAAETTGQSRMTRDSLALHLGMSAVLFVGERLVRPALRKQSNPADREPFYFDERVGANGEVFCMIKYRTMSSDTGEPLGRLARLARKFGLDESPQVFNIAIGDMRFFGRRALPVREHQAVYQAADPSLKADYDRDVAPLPPGMLNRFSTDHHQESGAAVHLPNAYMSSAIEDIRHNSWHYRAGTVLHFARIALTGKL